MKNILTAAFLIATSFWCVPSVLAANTASYTPPPKRGIVYIVCQFKPYRTGDMYPTTRVSVQWGSYQHSNAYGRGAFSIRLKVGFIITLRHTSNDSVRMEVNSEEMIEQVQQLDSPPPQWSDSKYDHYAW